MTNIISIIIFLQEALNQVGQTFKTWTKLPANIFQQTAKLLVWSKNKYCFTVNMKQANLNTIQ